MKESFLCLTKKKTYKLANEQILKENIAKMLKVIKEYISELELCGCCMRKADNLYFDSQKIVIINEVHNHQEKADKLAEIMNEGISPYAWYYYNTMNGYVVSLDKIEGENNYGNATQNTARINI